MPYVDVERLLVIIDLICQLQPANLLRILLTLMVALLLCHDVIMPDDFYKCFLVQLAGPLIATVKSILSATLSDLMFYLSLLCSGLSETRNKVMNGRTYSFNTKSPL